MSVRSTILAVAAVAASFAVTSIAVAPAIAAESVVVSYADLNLANAAGRQALDARLASAVDQVCADAALDARSLAASRACRADAGADAASQRDAVISGERRGTVRVSRSAN